MGEPRRLEEQDREMSDQGPAFDDAAALRPLDGEVSAAERAA